LSELGARLKETREAKGLSLDDLQRMTKIQKRYLKGIEEGNYDMMPGKFYVRAFIKQYAETIGLDPEPLFEEYKSDIPVAYNEDLPDQMISISRVQSRKTVSNNTSKAFNFAPTILFVVCIVAAFFLIWYVVQKVSSNHVEKLGQNSTQQQMKLQESGKVPKTAKNPAAASGSNSSNKSKDTSAGGSKTQSPPAQKLSVSGASGVNTTTYKLKGTKDFKITLKSTGQTWVNMKNGKGYSYFQGMLASGKSQSVDFSKETEAVLTIGRTTETEVYINGQKLNYDIPPSKSVNQTLTIQFEPSTTK
jgi:cytoskeletal protein RodZ